MEMNISQSAVTAGIQGLEATLGARLLARNAQACRSRLKGRGSCRGPCHHCRRRGGGAQPAGRGSASHRATAPGLTYTVAGYFMARHYAAFRRIYPGSRWKLSEQPRPAIENALLSGGLDLAVMLTSNLANSGELASETLFRSRRRLWLPSDHRLLACGGKPARCGVGTLRDADRGRGQPHGRALLGPLRADAANRVQHVFVEAVRSMVAAGMGVTILSDMVYRPWSLEGQRIEQRTTVEPIPSMDVGLTWPATGRCRGRRAVFSAFITAALGREPEAGARTLVRRPFHAANLAVPPTAWPKRGLPKR